jgi:ribosomal protein L24
MKYGDRIKVVNGEYKGKIGTVLGPIPWSRYEDLVTGRDIGTGPVKSKWSVELDGGKIQTSLENQDLELIVD